MVRTGQTPAAEHADPHVKVSAVLLGHDIRRGLGRPKQTVQRLIDAEVFRDSVLVSRIGVVVPFFELHKRDSIRPVAINLVRAHEDEHRFGAMATRGLQQVQGSRRIRVEIVEGDRRRKVM